MRQVLSWRFVAATVAVLALATGAFLLQSRRGSLSSLDSGGEQAQRRVDLISLVTAFNAPDFSIGDNGRSRGQLIVDIQIASEARQAQIFAGTPGVNECPELASYGCVLLAQTLGDTITWFALTPVISQFQFELPAIVDLQDGYARLTNGWEVPYAPSIDRSCDPDVASFAEFLDDHGSSFRSIYDLREESIIRVTCE